MNRQEASIFFRLRVVPFPPVPPNKAMQTDGRFAAAADRQGVRRTLSFVFQPISPRTRRSVELQFPLDERPTRNGTALPNLNHLFQLARTGAISEYRGAAGGAAYGRLASSR